MAMDTMSQIRRDTPLDHTGPVKFSWHTRGMPLGRRIAGIDLVALVLGVLILELALNRLAVPVLRPAESIPGWHRTLDRVALFTFYLASLVALGAALLQVFGLARAPRLWRPGLERLLAFLLLGLVALAGYAMFVPPSPATSLLVESSLAAVLVVVTVASTLGTGDVRARVGVIVILLPFFVHFYAAIAQVIAGENLANLQLRYLGHYALVGCAVLSPVLFAPPTRRAAPLLAAGFVGVFAFVILTRFYEVGMELAARGLGVELGPAAPLGLIVSYVLATALATYTLAATLSARHPGRRRVGIGLALLVVAGHGYHWPVHIVAVALGALAIARGAALLGRTPETEKNRTSFRPPRMNDDAWHGYRDQLAAALGAGQSQDDGIHASVGGHDVHLRFDRASGSLVTISVRVGEPRPDAAPDWTLASRPARSVGVGQHPRPPAVIQGKALVTGDAAFDERFRAVGPQALTDTLLDDDLRARATAILDGWLALWDGRTLVYEVWPGRGAPLDMPVPITELAFRSAPAPDASEKLVSVLELLSAIATRARIP